MVPCSSRGVAVTSKSNGVNYHDLLLEQLNKFSVESQQQLSSGVVVVVIPSGRLDDDH